MPLADLNMPIAVGAAATVFGLACVAYAFWRLRPRVPAPAMPDDNAAKLENYQLILDTLDRSNVFLWWARVSRTKETGRYHWVIRTPPQLRDNPIYRLASLADKGWLWNDELSPDHEEMDRISDAAITGGAGGYQHEFRIIGTDGVHWLSEEVIIRAAGPGEWNLVGVVTDITKRRVAEDARRSTEGQLDQILKGADCLLWQAVVTGDPDVEITWKMFIPPSVLFRKIFGEGLVPKNDRLWDESMVPEWKEITQRSRLALRDGRSEYEQEFCAISPGKRFILHEHVAVKRVGPQEWNLVGVVVDVTARRDAELALATEKERLAVTLGSMSEGVVTIDAHGRVLFVNRAAAEMSQWNASDVVGRDVGEVCVLRSAVNGAETSLRVGDVLERGLEAEIPSQTLIKGRSDRMRLIEGRLVPVADVSSKRIGAVLVFRDVTERHRMEETLQNAAKMESVGILAGGIAHDFNNILTAILSNLTLLQLDLGGDPKKALVDEAVTATKRAAELTLQLLTFAKGGDPVRKAVNLLEVVREATLFSLRGSSVRSEFDLPADLWAADADKGQIGQVIQNLVINATQAMPSGGTLRVTASNEHVTPGAHPVLSEGDYVRISVADTGEGIAPEHLGKIFDPYFTTKLHGHGLGLATAFSIVRRHQGHIEVTSVIGKGSMFTFWLPAVKSPQAKPISPAPFTSGQSKGRVLFMDDEEPILKMAERLMKRMGFDVESVTDGKAAIELYRSAKEAGRPFNVVIMDLTIPGGMGGREAISVLSKYDPKVRAIVSSGYSSDLAMSDFRKHGFRGMVAKPYDISELAAVIKSVIEEED
jgi:PAS domain S-box-containing protein